MNQVILNALYESGNKLGEVSAYALTFLMVIILVWVMFRYLNTKDLND